MGSPNSRYFAAIPSQRTEKLTAKASENGWLVQMILSFLGRLGPFAGANLLLVSGRIFLDSPWILV